MSSDTPQQPHPHSSLLLMHLQQQTGGLLDPHTCSRGGDGVAGWGNDISFKGLQRGGCTVTPNKLFGTARLHPESACAQQCCTLHQNASCSALCMPGA